MYTRSALLLTTVLALGACSNSQNASSRPPLPENILEMAAPDQDLATAYLRPEDNCYWYMHTSPVETTRLPLRTIEGNPICVKRAE